MRSCYLGYVYRALLKVIKLIQKHNQPVTEKQYWTMRKWLFLDSNKPKPNTSLEVHMTMSQAYAQGL